MPCATPAETRLAPEQLGDPQTKQVVRYEVISTQIEMQHRVIINNHNANELNWNDGSGLRLRVLLCRACADAAFLGRTLRTSNKSLPLVGHRARGSNRRGFSRGSFRPLGPEARLAMQDWLSDGCSEPPPDENDSQELSLSSQGRDAHNVGLVAYRPVTRHNAWPPLSSQLDSVTFLNHDVSKTCHKLIHQVYLSACRSSTKGSGEMRRCTKTVEFPAEFRAPQQTSRPARGQDRRNRQIPAVQTGFARQVFARPSWRSPWAS